MTKPLFHVYVDWGRDGAFTGADDITSYVMSVRVQSGFSDLLSGRTADVGKVSISLWNGDQRFSPGNTSSPYQSSKWTRLPLKITVTDEFGATHTVFQGFTGSFTPSSGTYGTRECRLEGYDALAILQAHLISVPLTYDQRGDQLVQHVLNDAFRGDAATGTLTYADQPADGDAITIDGETYTYKTTIASAGHIARGADVYASIDNLCAAINGAEGAGTTASDKYYTGTERPYRVSAAPTESWFELIRRSAPTRWYRLADTSGTVAVDRGSNNRPGTYVGGTLAAATGLSGDAPDFSYYQDGTTQQVTFPQIDLRSRSFTLSCWFRAENLPATTVAVIRAENGIGTSDGVLLAINNLGDFSGGIYGESGGETAVISDKTWYHAVFAYDHMTKAGALYLNGALTATQPSTSANGIDTHMTTFASDTAYDGRLDEVTLWLRCLSSEEILAHYAARSVGIGVTIKAQIRGAAGNDYAISESSTAITVSGATLAGGVDAPAGLTSLETARQSYAVAGDGWGRSNALSALEQIASSEIGLLWVARNGTITFKNRDYLFKRSAETPTAYGDDAPQITGDMQALYNRITVRVSPRQYLPTGVVAKAADIVEVKPAKQAEESGSLGGNKLRYNATESKSEYVTNIRLAYVDPGTGRVVGADQLVLPLVASTDYQASDSPEGIGGEGYTFDYTNSGHLKFAAVATANSIELDAQTATTGPLYVENLQVRGRAIVAYDPVEITREDTSSIETYGLRNYGADMPLPASINVAEAYAHYLRARYAEPAYRVQRVSFGHRGTFGYGSGVSVFGLEIGDVLVFTDPQLGLANKKHLVIGIRTDLDSEKGSVSLDVFALDDQTYGIYGDTTLGKYGSTFRYAI